MQNKENNRKATKIRNELKMEKKVITEESKMLKQQILGQLVEKWVDKNF